MKMLTAADLDRYSLPWVRHQLDERRWWREAQQWREHLAESTDDPECGYVLEPTLAADVERAAAALVSARCCDCSHDVAEHNGYHAPGCRAGSSIDARSGR